LSAAPSGFRDELGCLAVFSAKVNLGLAVKLNKADEIMVESRFLTLIHEGAMIHPCIHAFMLQCLVLSLCPQGTPMTEQFVAVPFSCLDATKTERARLAQGQQDMGVMIVRVVAVFEDGSVNGDVSHHATADKGLLHEA
jgi:hypothetical protein